MLGGCAHTARNLTFANLVFLYLTIVTLFTHFHDFAMHNIELVYYESGIQAKFYVENVLCKEDKIAEFEREDFEKNTDDKVVNCKQIDFEEFLSDEDWKRKEYQRTSFLRTKNSIYYLARSGCWDWFLTLTLSPDKVDRYNLVIDALKYLPQLGNRSARLIQLCKNKLVEHKHHIAEYGEDLEEVRNWKWQ